MVHHSFHYPTGWQTKRLVSILKMRTTYVLNIPFNADFMSYTNPCDMYHYKKYVNDTFIKWDSIDFPVGHDEIELFEEQNKHIAVNVYYLNPDTNSKTILLYKRSNNPQAQHKIDLIKLTDEVKSHYAYIKITIS